MTGFIALHRAAFTHPILKDAERFRAWFWLIAHAAWKSTKHNARGHTITVERGQLCAGREYLAKEWGWSPSAVERFLARLETEQMIERETGQKKTVITICNYDKYQDSSGETGQTTEHKAEQKSDRNRTDKEEGNKGTRETPFNPPSIKMALPKDWEPDLTPAAAAIVAAWPAGMLATEIEKFRDHAAAKGRRQVDWQAAFRVWITNANEWRNRDGTRNAAQRAGSMRSIGERVARAYATQP